MHLGLVYGTNLKSVCTGLRGGRGPHIIKVSRWAGCGASAIMQQFVANAFAKLEIPVELTTWACFDNDSVCQTVMVANPSIHHVFGDLMLPFAGEVKRRLDELYQCGG